jgi:hypothetical protein
MEIETFHKILKSGARAEETKLRTASRLVNLIAVLCIVSWSIFWMTMMNRVEPGADPRAQCTAFRLADAMCSPLPDSNAAPDFTRLTEDTEAAETLPA